MTLEADQRFMPPSVSGIGNAGGFTLQVEDRSGSATPQQLQAATQHLIDAARSRPELGRLFSTFRAKVPQIYVNVDRVKAKDQNVAVTDVSRRCKSISAASTSTISTTWVARSM